MQWKHNLAYSTVKRAVLNGHHDLEIFVQVNESREIRTFCTRQKRMTSVREPTYNTQNWVLDLDNIDCETIGDVTNRFQKIFGVKPFFVTKTRDRHYHVLIRGKYGEYPLEKRINLACQFAGLRTIPNETDQLKKELKSRGIDYDYLIQNEQRAAIRLPGSIVSRNSGISVCEGWEGTPIAPAIVVKALKVKKPKAKKTIVYWEKHESHINQLLKSAVKSQ
jgi:hypothetical protein